MAKKENAPAIETMINTAALALTSLGVVQITAENYIGFLCLGIGMSLEFFKYWGRHIKYW